MAIHPIGTAPTTETDRARTRVGVYLRQSLDLAGDELAVTRQEKACRSFLARRPGWDVVDVYCDNSVSASGRKARPEFARLLRDAQGGALDAVVALDIDRLTRTLRDLIPLLELADRHGVPTTTVNGDLDLSTESGRTTASILVAVANAEIRKKGQRQKLANAQRAEQGRRSQGGRRAFGYSPTDTIVPGEGKLIRAGAKAVLAGASATSVAGTWNAARTTTTLGGPWSHQSVRQVLTNPRYISRRIHNGADVGPAAWEPILDPETFTRLQAVFSNPTRRTNNTGGQRRRLLTGVALCGKCHAQGITTTVVGGSKGKDQPTYQCSRSKHLERNLAPVEWAVEEMVIAMLSRREALELLVDASAPLADALSEERERLVTVQRETAEDRAAGLVTREQLHAVNKKTGDRIAEIDAQLRHSTREAVLGDLVRSATPSHLWAELSLDRRQAVLNALGSWIVGPGKVGGNSRAGAIRYPSVESVNVTFTPAE